MGNQKGSKPNPLQKGLFTITTSGSVQTSWSPTEGAIVSKPINLEDLPEEARKMFEGMDDDAIAERVVTERDCSQDMVCWQYLKRKQYDTKEVVEQLDLIEDEVDLELKNTVLKPILRDVAKEFIEKYEWLGSLGTFKFGYGLYFPYKSGIGGKLGCVECFSKTTTWQSEVSLCGEKYRDKVILLCRGAAANWCKPNTNSYTISQVLKAVERDTQYRIVLAYSDRRAGEVGTVYQSTGWIFLGWGATGKDHVFEGSNITDMRFHTRGVPKELKSKSTMEEKGYGLIKPGQYNVIDVPRANKGKYVYFLGSRKERKELMDALRWRPLPYPKREDFDDPKKLKKFNARPRKVGL